MSFQTTSQGQPPPARTTHHHGLMTHPSSLCEVQRPLSVTPGRCFTGGVPSSELSSDDSSSWIHVWTQHDMSSQEKIWCKLLEIPGDLACKNQSLEGKGTPISSLNQQNGILM